MGTTGSTQDRPAVRVRSAWYVAGLVVGSFALHVRTMRSYFMGDDFEAIAAVVRTGPTLDWLSGFGPGSHLRPVLYADLWASHTAFGMDPLGWRVENVLLHALAAWLVAVLADDLLARGAVADEEPHGLRAAAAPLAGVLFLVGPAHVEPVSWIVARVDPLLTVFSVGSLLAWIRWRRGRPAMLALSLVGLALALYTKESVLPLVAVVVAYELWLPEPASTRRASMRRAAPGLVAYGAVTLAYLIHYLSIDAGYLTDEGDVLGSESPALLVRRAAQVAIRTVVPALSMSAWVAVAVVMVGVTVAAAIAVVRRPTLRRSVVALGPTLGFLGTALVVTVAPVARLGVSPFTTAGERLAYLPSVFSTIAVAIGLGLVLVHAPRWGRVAVVGAVVVAALALVVGDGTYVRGGQLAETSVRSQASWSQDRQHVVVLAPDTLEGAWVGRNAYGPALELVHGWAQTPNYVELGAFRAASVDDVVEVERGGCPRCVRLSMVDPDAEVVAPAIDRPEATTWAGVTVVERTDRSIEVELGPEIDPATVWYVTEGRFRSLEGVFDA